MKKLTITDFIKYNDPCFICGNKTMIYVYNDYPPNNVLIRKTDFRQPLQWRTLPEITPYYIKICLKQCYDDKNTIMFSISHKTHEIKTNNLKDLTKYLEEHKLYLESICNNCGTEIQSEMLEIDLSKSWIMKAISIRAEHLFFDDSKNKYVIYSYVSINSSCLDIVPKNKELSPTQLQLPLMLKYHFKDKKHLLNRINNILLLY
jgi:hypothetical protein